MRRGYFGALAMLAAMALLCVLTSLGVASPGATARVSVDSSGAEANARSSLNDISANGRYVAFASNATNLVPGDTNGRTDIFVRDLQTGTTERASVDSFEAQANGNSPNLNNGGPLPSISADGRYVAFISDATNLVPGDTNGRTDAFVRDLQTGTTERVSVNSSGGQTAGVNNVKVAISADGRYVTFADTRIFVRDRQVGTTELVSVSSSGVQANDFSQDPSISADGRYITFTSDATNLVPGDTTGLGLGRDVFVRDRQAGTTERVSVSSSGTEADGNSFTPSISADGRYVAFISGATNLAADDINGVSFDVFLHDRQMGTTQRVNVNGCPTPAQALGFSGGSEISADGRYVAFTSDASNLVADDTNEVSDVLVRDLQAGTTQRVSLDSSGTQANDFSGGLSISANGSHVAFGSNASNLVADDTNGVGDVFVHERREAATQPDDCVAPTTTASAITVSGAYEPGTWTNEDVTLTLNAQENESGSGIKDIRYSATGAQSIPETVYDEQNPPIIVTEGTTTISYFATDSMGNQESPAKTLTVKIDKTPPAVSSTSPRNKATGVKPTANLGATFSENGSGIDPSTLTNSTFKVVQVKSTGNVAVAGTVSYTSPTVIFDPSKNLAKGTYRAALTGVADRSGNAMPDVTWTFATASPSKR